MSPDAAVVVLDAVPAWAGVATQEQDVREFEPTDVTPGILGFAVTFAVVLGLVVLLVSMTGKLRRVNHRTDEADDGDVPDEPDGRPGP